MRLFKNSWVKGGVAMLALSLVITNAMVLAYILISSLMILNQMSRHTPHHLRVIYIFLCVGAFYSLTKVQDLQFPSLLFNIATAYFVNNMRFNRCEITGTHKALGV